MAATWLCPSCGRRVPATLDECRCGAPRAAAVLAQRSAAQRHRLPKDVLGLVVLMVLVLVAGLVALFLPYGPNKLPKILGIVDRPRPPATPTPAPKIPPARR